jgi:acetoacetate decarboxylase
MPPTPQLEVRYLTDPDVYRAVLPPPLEPAAEPRVHLRVTDIDLQFGDFKHAEKILYFAVEALLDGAPVHYPLTYLLNLESAVSPSRERFGEPKKLAGVEIDREGSHVRASVTRSGITLVEIQGDVTEARERWRPCRRPRGRAASRVRPERPDRPSLCLGAGRAHRRRRLQFLRARV